MLVAFSSAFLKPMASSVTSRYFFVSSTVLPVRCPALLLWPVLAHQKGCGYLRNHGQDLLHILISFVVQCMGPNKGSSCPCNRRSRGWPGSLFHQLNIFGRVRQIIVQVSRASLGSSKGFIPLSFVRPFMTLKMLQLGSAIDAACIRAIYPVQLGLHAQY